MAIPERICVTCQSGFFSSFHPTHPKPNDVSATHHNDLSNKSVVIRTNPGNLSQDWETLGYLEEHLNASSTLMAVMICSSSREVSVNRKASHLMGTRKWRMNLNSFRLKPITRLIHWQLNLLRDFLTPFQ
jgi:hypothetical protein